MRIILSVVLSIASFSLCAAGMAAEQSTTAVPAAAPVTEQDMVLTTATGKIAGSLLLPAKQGKVPVVLELIS